MEILKLKKLLDDEYSVHCSKSGLFSEADPLQVARELKDPVIMLCCALFAYGNARLIVKFLKSLDFSLIYKSQSQISAYFRDNPRIYRFENAKDLEQIFITFSRLKDLDIQAIIKKGFEKNAMMIDGINALISCIYGLNEYRSLGYNFYFAKVFEKSPKAPYKRYNMWLRWCVRDSDIDLGIFKNLPKSELILPLDTHTHKVAQALKLCSRRVYDFKSALEITQNLKQFDPNDPIKYDFALYRLGQSGKIKKLLENFK